MGQEVFAGRYTATPGRPVTVFLIGMRANRWWKLGTVLRVGSAMGTMLRHLSQNPEAGMLGFHQWLGRTTMLVSYWESPEHLQRFAANRDAPHLAPWRDFMRTVAGSGDVGVWHETYQTPGSGIETVYSGMPRFGLARAIGHVPVSDGLNTARQRLRTAGAA
ncbi:DUF4188 domain-containing protein [Sinomonas notoginsengisoli]|uniref:DUF4188 domain-containing protein n=1 Tax=Sinomonas notoginsengisoli TaxID=1457311 RepID=UPI001F3FE29F|nr:DUF4188 domain-containing protein [Sinomonas notoginsengisoli]